MACTDTTLKDAEVLRRYALRWGIEVYFKEAKQHFGLLSEQTGKYTKHYASIHLTAIRYLLILHVALKKGGLPYGKVRNRIANAIEEVTFATVLWAAFEKLIGNALDSLQFEIPAEMLAKVMATIQSTVRDALQRALQMDEQSIQAQLYAERIGAL